MNSIVNFNNGLGLQLDLEGQVFKGIGRVTYRGRVLRAATLPWNFYTESEGTDCGFRFEDFVLEQVREEPEAVEIVLTSEGRTLPRIQEADAMGEARIRNRRVRPPVARFTWRFQAIREEIYGNVWDGLSMRVSYECPGHPIHWLLEQATWELGGEASGNTLIQQDVSAMDLEKVVAAGDSFSTIEKFFTDGWGGSYPMDMLPRAAGAAICDFQAKDDVALCLFSENPGLTRARLDKYADENIVHYLDRCYFPLAEKACAQERKLLVFQSPATLEKHEIRNLWLDCFTEVRRRIHAVYGFTLEIPEPCSGGHLWDKELKERMEKWLDPLERDFPEYARLGYRQAFIHGVWDSITSDPNPPSHGNICCPYAFRFAEVFGGPGRMKRLNESAQASGLRLMQWFSFHLSCHAPVWKEHPDWVLKEANGDPWDGNYHTLFSGRIRSDYGREFMRQILDVNKDTGIGGIFWDSYQNLGVTGIDWGAPDKAPQADEIFRMQTQLQKAGFKQRVEVVTIFGVTQVAIFGFSNDKFRRRLWDDFLAGDQAFTLMDCSPAFFTAGEGPVGPNKLNPERYFWMAAHRVLPGIGADPWELGGNKSRLPGGEFAEDFGRVNHLYNALVPHMHRLRLQPEGTHALWLDANNKPAVIWAFRDVSVRDLTYVVDVESKEAGVRNGELKAGRVYGLQPGIDWPSLLARETGQELI